ncbi:hypothetical protein NALG_0084 [Lactococcus formosensis]|nr:hypothetical protein NALG_0084 [Lactococcus formosensis]
MKKILFGFLAVLLILDIGFFWENVSYTQTGLMSNI